MLLNSIRNEGAVRDVVGNVADTHEHARKESEDHMAVEVRIPTILRQYTGGAKLVEGSGDTLVALIDDLESRHEGLSDRLLERGELRKFVNVYLNDEDVRFLGGLKTSITDGDSVTILPAVAGGGA
jgi:molybdopterin converting factor small subunit